MAREAEVDSAWRVLLGAGLCMFCGQPAMVLFTFGLFSPAIASDTGWPATTLATVIAPATLAGALLSPAVGRCADVIGVRRMVLLGGPAYGLGFLLLAYFSHQLWQFTALLVLLCALGFAATPVLHAQLAAGWFARRRGLALSLIFSCTSLGIAFWSTISAQAIEALGWRSAYAIIGVVAGTIMSLAALLLVRDPPVVSVSYDKLEADGISASHALRDRRFWIIAIVFMLLTGVVAGTAVSLPIILRIQGASATTAASILAVVGAAMFIGRLSSGVILDRCFAPRVTAAIAMLSMLALAGLAIEHRGAVLYVTAALLGLGLGSEMDAAAYLTSRAFGQRSFGAIYGGIALAYGIASAIGPAAIGMVLNAGVAPSVIFLTCLATLLPALFLVFTLRARDFPYGMGAVRK